MNNLLIAGLCDVGYWNYIGKFCLPTWRKFEYDRILITDDTTLIDKEIAYTYSISEVLNLNSSFYKSCTRKKPVNFWKKIQSQIWTFRKFRDVYDYILFLDTDIEIVNYNSVILKNYIENLKDSNKLWSLGTSDTGGLDAGMFLISTKNSLLEKFLFDYEQIWETGKIFEFHRPYDGEAVDFLKQFYLFNEIENINYGNGQHYYKFGGFHWGGKESKQFRNTLIQSEKYINEIVCLDKFNK